MAVLGMNLGEKLSVEEIFLLAVSQQCLDLAQNRPMKIQFLL